MRCVEWVGSVGWVEWVSGGRGGWSGWSGWARLGGLLGGNIASGLVWWRDLGSCGSAGRSTAASRAPWLGRVSRAAAAQGWLGGTTVSTPARWHEPGSHARGARRRLRFRDHCGEDGSVRHPGTPAPRHGTSAARRPASPQLGGPATRRHTSPMTRQPSGSAARQPGGDDASIRLGASTPWSSSRRCTGREHSSENLVVGADCCGVQARFCGDRRGQTVAPSGGPVVERASSGSRSSGLPMMP